MGLLNSFDLSLGLFFTTSMFTLSIVNRKFFKKFYWSNLLLSLIQDIVKGFYSKNSLGMMTFNIFIFMLIFLFNSKSLLPYFCAFSSHFSNTLCMGFMLWVGILLSSLYNNKLNMLSHLVPKGTPIYLIFVMVLIELVSFLIRPLTLSLRLCANILAGHMIMGLLGELSLSQSVWAFILLTIMEIFVSIIQAYIFYMLVSLYLEEMS